MKFNKIIILGGGMVGSAIAQDLKKSGYFVTVADINVSLHKFYSNLSINFIKIDFTDTKQFHKVLKDYHLVIGAVPGFMGYEVLKEIILSGKNVVDISFMSEDSKNFDKLAKDNNVIAITDAGIAPGLSNLIFGKEINEFTKLEVAKCYVGGLPQDPIEPWLYKSVFSPIDVIEEYTRPARLVENGKQIIKPAMTDIEKKIFKGIGELDAFNSDGLRSLLSLPIPNMVEKTLRFSGHIQKIIELKNNGKFEPDKIRNTAESLISEWAPRSSDYDQTIMKLEFEGYVNNEWLEKNYVLIDYYDHENSITSMARTTGYTCTAIVNVLEKKLFNKTGVFNLEELGSNNKIFNEVIKHLEARSVSFDKQI